MMTDHPAAGCTKAQRETFERIAIGHDACVHPATAKALITRGLIVATKETLPPTRSCQWSVQITCYHVPLPIHAQWCLWAAENVTNEDEAAADAEMRA